MKFKIEYKKTDALIPYAQNARTHSENQVSQIAASIEKFGFVNPVLRRSDFTIIAGHGRVLAAKQLKLKEVPTIVLDHLSEREANALVLADNKLALNSGWDFEKLSNEISALAELDFDISIIGFDEQELDALLKDAADILPSGSLEPESVVNVASHTRTYTNSEVDIDNLENIMILKIKLSEKNFFKVKSALEKIDENVSEAIVKLIDQQY
jgi:ParB-like chromosome segregation protein Spo0J